MITLYEAVCTTNPGTETHKVLKREYFETYAECRKTVHKWISEPETTYCDVEEYRLQLRDNLPPAKLAVLLANHGDFYSSRLRLSHARIDSFGVLYNVSRSYTNDGGSVDTGMGVFSYETNN